MAAPPGADEAGFLQVAHQWSSGGDSLYGSYWVDRPPLLISLFRVADLAGGMIALRLLGCLAVAVTVLLAARSANRLAGPRAAPWAALVAAALLVSPFLDAGEVNGELMTAPFVAAGILALVEAVAAPERRRAAILGAAGGAAAVSAMMVKQNVADVLVFGLVYVATAARRRSDPAVRWRAVATGGLLGGAAALAGLSAWTVMHGTSLVEVFDAVYPFRLRAAQVVAAGGSQYARVRAGNIAVASVTSGAAVLAGSLVLAARHRRVRDAAVVALTVTLAYDVVSIALGGGYWRHYLVELAVPLAVLTGVLIARRARGPRYVALAMSVVSVGCVVGYAARPHDSAGQDVGSAIRAVELPGDTLTTLYGAPQVNLAAGLPSPYPQLWSLPVKTLDPHLQQLDGVLGGPAPPTWLVVTNYVGSWGLDTSATQRLIDRRYHEVAVVDGETIYLLDGEARRTPATTTAAAAAIR